MARITLDRPDNGNRIHYPMMVALIEALERATADRAAVLVLDAEGEDFTWGRDQKDVPPAGVTRRQSLSLILRANALLRAFPGVSVSRIQGHALGFGTGLALHSIISLAAADAVFGFDEIDHGLAPLVVVAYLPHFVGPRRALEWVLTGRRLGAPEALEAGVVSRVVPRDALRQEGEAVVQALLTRPVGALRLIRSFDRRLPSLYPAADVGQAAVDELDGWLSAGRPPLD